MTVTFVVEDGTGLATATSYVTIDEFKQYWFNCEYNYGDLTDTDIERLLNKATFYIDSNYRKSFPGYRQEETQKLEWPRSSAYYLNSYSIDEDTVPQEIKDAVCEASYLSNSGEDLTATVSKSGKITKAREKVDVLETEYEYESSFYSDIYTIIDDTLSRITGGTSDRFVLSIVRVGGESP